MTERVCEVHLSLLLAVEFSVKFSVAGVWFSFASSIPPFFETEREGEEGWQCEGGSHSDVEGAGWQHQE